MLLSYRCPARRHGWFARRGPRARRSCGVGLQAVVLDRAPIAARRGRAARGLSRRVVTARQVSSGVIPAAQYSSEVGSSWKTANVARAAVAVTCANSSSAGVRARGACPCADATARRYPSTGPCWSGVLYGSMARGDDRRGSDVDVLVELGAELPDATSPAPLPGRVARSAVTRPMPWPDRQLSQQVVRSGPRTPARPGP
jgi:hypothetical protein